jgi:hypothetical protein
VLYTIGEQIKNKKLNMGNEHKAKVTFTPFRYRFDTHRVDCNKTVHIPHCTAEFCNEIKVFKKYANCSFVGKLSTSPLYVRRHRYEKDYERGKEVGEEEGVWSQLRRQKKAWVSSSLFPLRAESSCSYTQ